MSSRSSLQGSAHCSNASIVSSRPRYTGLKSPPTPRRRAAGMHLELGFASSRSSSRWVIACTHAWANASASIIGDDDRSRRAPPRRARADRRDGRGHPGERGEDRRLHRPRPRRRRQPGGVPRAGADRVSARGPAAEDAFPRRRGRRPRGAGRPDAGDRGAGGLSGAGRRRLQLGRRAGRRRGQGGLPQDLPAQLRRVRRAALLPGRRRARADRGERRHARPDHLRGHLGAGPARVRRGAGRGRGDREPLGLPVPRRQGRRAGADARPAGARQRGGRAVLQHDRRPGRAGLRRPQRRARPGWRAAGARTPVRGGARALHGRLERGHGRAAAGSAA